MTKLLIRLFIKDSDNIQDLTVRSRYGVLGGITGIVTNLLLFLCKILAGIVANSISIMADAVNNLSDAASSVITLVGFKLSEKPADKEHPFGHARFEYLSGLAVSVLIVIIGFELGKTSVLKIMNPEQVEYSYLSIGVLVVAMLAKLWQGTFYKYLGKRINSTAMNASATDSISDVITTGAVLLSVIISRVFHVQLDAYMGLAVAAFILYSGCKLISETLDPILGQMPDESMVKELKDRILGYDGVLGIHDMLVHGYGPGRNYASVHVEVSAGEDILVSHDLIDNIEREIENAMNVKLVIHLDPVVVDDDEVNELRKMVKDIVANISTGLSMHDFRVVKGPSHTNIIFDIAVPYDCKISNIELLTKVREDITAVNETYFAVITLDRTYIAE